MATARSPKDVKNSRPLHYLPPGSIYRGVN
jgi:hypothetical protein